MKKEEEEEEEVEEEKKPSRVHRVIGWNMNKFLTSAEVVDPRAVMACPGFCQERSWLPTRSAAFKGVCIEPCWSVQSDEQMPYIAVRMPGMRGEFVTRWATSRPQNHRAKPELLQAPSVTAANRRTEGGREINGEVWGVESNLEAWGGFCFMTQ